MSRYDSGPRNSPPTYKCATPGCPVKVVTGQRYCAQCESTRPLPGPVDAATAAFHEQLRHENSRAARRAKLARIRREAARRG